MLKTNCFKLTIALIVLMGTSIISSGQKVSVQNLPQIEDFTVTFLDKPTRAGNAVLSLKFSGDKQLPENFSIQLDQKRRVEFSDTGEKTDKSKGDGVFTGLAFFKQEEILTPTMRNGGKFPVFSGRSLVGYKEFPPVQEIKANEPIRVNSLGNPANIDAERSLLIRDPKVVQDKYRTRTSCESSSMGVWSFGHLMTEMANQSQTGIDPRDFAMQWLLEWYKDEVVNTFVIGERREGIRELINKWKKDSDGKLDLGYAPMRLLAIVNRADLRGIAKNSKILRGYGDPGPGEGEESTDGGELRFVFGVLDPETCSPERFTVIFEYGVTKKGCQEMQNWAISWAKLAAFELGSPEYNRALEKLTQSVVLANSNPEKPNGSALNQLRTNEISLASPWELREFTLGPEHVSFLNSATIKQTPDRDFNETNVLAKFINQFEGEILADKHKVTEEFDGSPFLAAAIEYDASDFWRAEGINNNDARHKFSLNTCNSCHGRETDTSFLQIGTAPFGNVTADLSGFLRGSTPSTSDIEFLNVSDPVDSTDREFNDLLRRAADLDALINTPCGRMFAVPTEKIMTH
jgi:hypothetical protein